MKYEGDRKAESGDRVRLCVGCLWRDKGGLVVELSTVGQFANCPTVRGGLVGRGGLARRLNCRGQCGGSGGFEAGLGAEPVPGFKQAVG